MVDCYVWAMIVIVNVLVIDCNYASDCCCSCGCDWLIVIVTVTLSMIMIVIDCDCDYYCGGD